MFTKNYDLSGMGITRLIKHLIMNRFLLVGNMFGNPGLRYLTILMLLHFLGGPIYWLLTRWERPLRFLLSRLRRIKQVLA